MTLSPEPWGFGKNDAAFVDAYKKAHPEYTPRQHRVAMGEEIPFRDDAAARLEEWAKRGLHVSEAFAIAVGAIEPPSSPA